MRIRLGLILKYLIPVLVASVISYQVALKPRLAASDKLEAEVRTLEAGVDGLQSSLGRQPPLLPAEQELWKVLDARIAETLFEESNLTAALAGLSDLVHRAGATLVTVTLEGPASTRGATGASEARVPGVAPPVPEVPPSTGGAAIIRYPVTLKARGRYATWPAVLTEMSRDVVPVLLDRVEGRPGVGGAVMTVSLTVPAIRSREAAEAAESRRDEGPPIEIPRSVALLYGLDKLREPISSWIRSVQTEPFRPLPSEQGEFPLPSAIIERDGQYVAVIDGKVVSAGDEIDGKRILKVTSETVIFARW